MSEMQWSDGLIEENVRFYLDILRQCANAQFDYFRRSHAQRFKDAAAKKIDAAIMYECECIVHGIMADFLSNSCIQLGMDKNKAVALGKAEMKQNAEAANGKFTTRLRKKENRND